MSDRNNNRPGRADVRAPSHTPASSAPAKPRNSTPTFAQLGVAAEICDALAADDIVHSFAIQELTLPIALDGKDVIGQARTGMGKTLGFGVPLIDRIFDDASIAELDGTPRGLVIVPTRELARQVHGDLSQAARNTPVEITTVYGGRSIDEQVERLKSGVDIVVGTPGRLVDLHQRGHLALDNIAILVLDEADEMLDLGFLPDIQKILHALEATEHQTMLFSATMPGAIVSLARTFLTKPIHIHAEDPGASTTHKTTKQLVFRTHQLDKMAVLSLALQTPSRRRAVVFTRTKRSAGFVAADLAQLGFHVAAVHGDLHQSQREVALRAFREGEVDILVATDVAARGIDIEGITHVINYHTPDDPSSFVHRIGRTGRAGKTGTAITMVGFEEAAKWSAINDELDLGLSQPPEWFSTSPELFSALDLAPETSPTVGPSTSVIGARRPSRRPSRSNNRTRSSSSRKRS